MRTTRNDWRFGQNQAQRILRRQGYEMAGHYPRFSNPKWIFWFDVKVKTTKLALKKIIGDAVLTPFELHTCLLEVAKPVNERPIGAQNPKWSRRWCLSLSKRHLFGQSHRVPQGPFRHTDKGFYSKSWQHKVFWSNREQILLSFESARLTLTLLYTILEKRYPFHIPTAL